jgi:NAD(P)-dependent dehydrogenase (short-subunit alcohol dehydrogenase family)
MKLPGKTAVVIGASSGVGKATVKSLLAEGVQVTAVARAAGGLEALKTELGPGVETVRGDAADPKTSEQLLRELRPDFVVLTAGVRPQMGAVDALSWEAFSEAWNTDTQAAFHLVQAALRTPLSHGSVVAVVSSGAALQGSYLSGGYAGAKRMQWWLASYAEKVAAAKNLGIRFLAILPKQLIEGTAIASLACAGYSAALGIAPSEYMKRFDVPLDCDKVASAILAGLRGGLEPSLTAFAVTGSGVEPLG